MLFDGQGHKRLGRRKGHRQVPGTRGARQAPQGAERPFPIPVRRLGVQFAQPAENRCPENELFEFQQSGMRPAQGLQARRVATKPFVQGLQGAGDLGGRPGRIQPAPTGPHLLVVLAVIRRQAAHEQSPIGKRRVAGDVGKSRQSRFAVARRQLLQGLAHGGGIPGDIRPALNGVARVADRGVGQGGQGGGLHGGVGYRLLAHQPAQQSQRRCHGRGLLPHLPLGDAELQEVLERAAGLGHQTEPHKLLDPLDVRFFQDRAQLGRGLLAPRCLGILKGLLVILTRQAPANRGDGVQLRACLGLVFLRHRSPSCPQEGSNYAPS